WAGENTVLQLFYTVSQTSRWRWLCADVLRKRKAGKNIRQVIVTHGTALSVAWSWQNALDIAELRLLRIQGYG
ncbi:hypothetical protein ACWJPP_26720, partial [Klebsiella pneumoniae]